MKIVGKIYKRRKRILALEFISKFQNTSINSGNFKMLNSN